MSIIEVENIGKRYYIGQQREGYLALRDVLSGFFKSPIKWLRGKLRTYSKKKANEFWALSDVNFKMEKGEVLGVIGRNGAGKSTLLKILSQITPPTTGQIKIQGSVGSLLEVGTGFHPELTGRENIFLNGAILGMRRAEIVKKFDEIVEFSGIGKFLDTPVKRYSSGMYVRLAFAVAAHLEPDILLIDEVLAVGDSEFQKKCLQKMEDITQKQGRTIIFVSHNIGAVQQLCQKCILLENGKIEKYGPTAEVVNYYLNKKGGAGRSHIYSGQPADNFLPEFAELTAAKVTDQSGNPTSEFGTMQDIYLEMEYHIKQPLVTLMVDYHLFDEDNNVIFTVTDHDTDASASGPRATGSFVARSRIPKKFLKPGKYFVTIEGFGQRHYFTARDALSFNVFVNGGPMSVEKRRIGIISPEFEWKTINK